MKKIYVSSTYKDLIDYRKAVFAALRKVRHDVIGMEDYVAKDQCTVARCQADVASCDLYIGIFAWRYGYVPEEDNPDKKSITELEYKEASDKGKTRLIFLLDNNVPWSPELMDSYNGENKAGKRIKQFRTALAKRSASLFKSPDDLATQVIAAVYQNESTKRVEKLGLFDDIKSFDLGPSGLPNISEKIIEAKATELVEINLGSGKSWWTTRLHLVAALATDFTNIQQLIFVSEAGRFIAMYSPIEVRQALASAFPKVEIAYLLGIEPLRDGGMEPEWQVTAAVANFGSQMYQLSEGKGEENIKKWVTQDLLQQLMVGKHSGEYFELAGQPRSSLQLQIATCRSPYVALVENRRLVRVVDRVAMVTNLARDVIMETFQ